MVQTINTAGHNDKCKFSGTKIKRLWENVLTFILTLTLAAPNYPMPNKRAPGYPGALCGANCVLGLLPYGAVAGLERSFEYVVWAFGAYGS